jgi:SAM-dependent methyltransferase
MKKSINKILIVTAIIFLASCEENGPYHPKKHKGEHQHANHHMNKIPFEDLVKNFQSSERNEWQKPDEVITFLGDLKNKTVIDIGAGTGYLEFKVKDTSSILIAADVDERFINYMKERIEKNGVKHIITRKAEYDRPPVMPGEADVVFMIDVYHHIENRTPYFYEVKKGLKTGGKLIIVDFKKGDFKQGPPDAMKIESKQVIEEMISAGFKLSEEDSETLPYQYMLKFE